MTNRRLLLLSNGSELIAALRAQAPGLPVIAVSGMAVTDFLSDAPALSDVVCLQKPFKPADLMNAVQAAQAPCPQAREQILLTQPEPGVPLWVYPWPRC